MKKYIKLKDLEVYKLARELSAIVWGVYEKLDWQDRKIMGDQFIESADSVGSNIAEGYGRYHYLDRIKFYYNARASFAEAYDHWLELLYERRKIKKEIFEKIKGRAEKLSIKLNNFISATYNAKESEQ
jgi:four helix bundle protein